MLSASCYLGEFEVSGVASIDWSAGGLDTGNAQLRVEAGGAAATFDAAKGSGRVAVHTHLLANGPHTIDFSLIDRDGATISACQLGLRVANDGAIATALTASLRARQTPLMFDGVCDSSYYDYRDPALTAWFDRPDALDQIQRQRAAGALSARDADVLAQFVVDGYTVVDEVIDDERIAAINAEIDDAIAKGYQGYKYGTSQRIEHLHQHYPHIRRLWLDAEIFRLLTLIFREGPRPCQSLTYVFGSQQGAHSDSIHLTSMPAGYMCGVWIALEDVREGSGELEVYPGSHRLPYVRMADVGIGKVAGEWKEFGATFPPRWQGMVADRGLEKRRYLAKRGSALIWHENLLHAGSPRVDQSLSRRSIVSHVFANGAIAYYDSTGLSGILEPRERLTQTL